MKRISIGFIALLTILFIAKEFVVLTDKEETTITTQTTKKQTTINLKLAHNTPVDSALHEASVKFADAIQLKTKGKVLIEIFPAQQLGNDHQMVEMARKGEIDILLTPTAKMSIAVPSLQYADLPFYFPTREDVYEMLDGEPGQMILNDLKSIGLIGVTFWENGFKHFSANTPLLKVEDFKDKKFRVMKSRIIMDQFKSLGAEPIPIDFHSTKKALHDRVVDGQENPLVAIVSMEFYKEQSDLTLSEHAYLGYVLSFSQKTFHTLPQHIQMTLLHTAKEITPWEREETHKRETQLLETIAASGVKIHTITEQERKRFVQKTAHIPSKFEEFIGPNIISKTKELLYDKYGANLNNTEHILIGIDVDVSADSKIGGLAIKRGAQIAVEEINSRGGILAKPIELVLKDHRATASKGVENIKEFAKNKNLAAIIGGVHGAVISAELETIQKLKIPYLIPWAATAGLINNNYTDNYVFRLSASDKLASTFILKYALKKHSKPAIIVENSIWGRSNLELMREYCKKHKIEDVVEIVYNRGQLSFEKEVAQIIRSGADSIVMIANPHEGSSILQALYASKKNLSVISHWGITSGNFFKENKQILEKINLTVFQTFSFAKPLNKKAQALEKRYREKYSIANTMQIKAPIGVAQAYDAVHLIAKAIQKADSIEHQKVKNALENLPRYKGVLKEYSPAFTPKIHEALDDSDYYMAKYDHNGHLLPVKEH